MADPVEYRNQQMGIPPVLARFKMEQVQVVTRSAYTVIIAYRTNKAIDVHKFIRRYYFVFYQSIES